MKTKHAAGLLAAIALATSSSSLMAQPTNFIAYNFDTDQVDSTPYGTAWGNWFGGDYQGVTFDPTQDANNNPASGSMQLNLTESGSGQYVLLDGFYPAAPPWYGPLSLQTFTNLSFDMRYDGSSAIRTNTSANGVNGSQGVGSLDFGYMRIGSISQPANTYGQSWYFNFAIPATNGLGNPNTNWIHINIPLATTAGTVGGLSADGIEDVLIGQDGADFGNNVLVGNQILHFDNIEFSGFVAPIPPPHLSISKPTPALRFFSGSGQFGRSQMALAADNNSWIGGTFPVSYTFTLMDNATAFPTPVDTHIHIIQGDNQYSGADFTDANALWLQILSTPSNAVTAQVQWKTNHPNANPGQDPGTTSLVITNPVRAGTWTLTFLTDTNGTLTAPGGVNVAVPFNLGVLADADATTDFANPTQVRYGLQNNNNPLNGGIPDDWASIGVSGTAGTNFTEDFTHDATDQISTNWNLGNNDGAGNQVQVPTNAPYWVSWNTPDNGFLLTVATSLTTADTNWALPEFYNSYTDGSNAPGTQVTQAKVRWNLILPAYLPTANGAQGTNQFTVGGPAASTAFFRLQTNSPTH